MFTNKQTLPFLTNGRLTFLQQFLKHPLQIGSIIPSSRFLERRVVETADVRSAKVIVELGSGTGGITRAILQKMAPDANLLSIEINPIFHTLVGHIADRRLIAHLGNAINLVEILAAYSLQAPEVVISGIPFSTMSHSLGTEIIKSIASALTPDGRFVGYQLNSRIAALSRPLLGPGKVEAEFLNIPPMRVYRWDINNG